MVVAYGSNGVATPYSLRRGGARLLDQRCDPVDVQDRNEVVGSDRWMLSMLSCGCACHSLVYTLYVDKNMPCLFEVIFIRIGTLLILHNDYFLMPVPSHTLDRLTCVFGVLLYFRIWYGVAPHH